MKRCLTVMRLNRLQVITSRCAVRFGLLLIAIVSLAPISTMGLGSRIPNQDAEAIARGNAFVATADNPSAMYYNPAGITQLEGQNFQVGSLFYLNIYADYVSPPPS